MNNDVETAIDEANRCILAVYPAVSAFVESVDKLTKKIEEEFHE